jgi:hypothetical protein
MEHAQRDNKWSEILVEKPEWKRPLRMHRGKWKNIIKVDTNKIWSCVLDSSGTGQNAVTVW